MISFMCYAIAVVNTVVSFGLLLLHTHLYREWDWNPPFQAPKSITLIFFLSNVFLLIVPLMPPTSGSKSYVYLPYWSHVLGTGIVMIIGSTYWCIQYKWMPGRTEYKLENEIVEEEDNDTLRHLARRSVHGDDFS